MMVDSYKIPVVYAVKHKSESIRAASRSGGIFTALSDWILEQSGVVYGCVLNERFEAVHKRAESLKERDLMRGSKYVQSQIADTYRQAKDDLERNRYVLFSGTSCQIAGLRAYLRKDYEKLYTVDIVCHGVPSPKVWRDYVQWNEQKQGARVKTVIFRNKADYGWNSHVETLLFENGKRVDSRVFTKLFYGHTILRPCCYQCPYKDIVHPGDITIADYWGIDKAAPGFNDNKGVSLVLINNAKGKNVFDAVAAKEELDIAETKIEDSMQPPLKAPFPEPENRGKFWDDYKSESFAVIADKYGKDRFITRVKKYIKKKVKVLLKKS